MYLQCVNTPVVLSDAARRHQLIILKCNIESANLSIKLEIPNQKRFNGCTDVFPGGRGRITDQTERRMDMNLPTFVILLILAVAVGAVVRKMIKDKKAGKGCSGCSGCSSGGCCGAHQDTHMERN